jgi:hypothetical protein
MKVPNGDSRSEYTAHLLRMRDENSSNWRLTENNRINFTGNGPVWPECLLRAPAG